MHNPCPNHHLFKHLFTGWTTAHFPTPNLKFANKTLAPRSINGTKTQMFVQKQPSQIFCPKLLCSWSATQEQLCCWNLNSTCDCDRISRRCHGHLKLTNSDLVISVLVDSLFGVRPPDEIQSPSWLNLFTSSYSSPARRHGFYPIQNCSGTPHFEGVSLTPNMTPLSLTRLRNTCDLPLFSLQSALPANNESDNLLTGTNKCHYSPLVMALPSYPIWLVLW